MLSDDVLDVIGRAAPVGSRRSGRPAEHTPAVVSTADPSAPGAAPPAGHLGHPLHGTALPASTAGEDHEAGVAGQRGLTPVPFRIGSGRLNKDAPRRAARSGPGRHGERARQDQHTTEVPMNTGIRLAADLDAISREEIDRLRAHNFTQLVTAARRTPAVLRRWPGLDSVHSLDRLPELPVLTPGALADGCPPHSMEFLMDGDQPGMVLRSSGTASKVKMMYHSWAFNEQVSMLGARGLRAALPAPPHRVANCLYGADLNGSFLFTQEIARLLGARVYPLGNVTSIADTAKMIAEHAIDTLAAPPGYGVDLLTTTPPDMLAPLRTYLYIGESLGASRTTALTDALPGLTVRSLAYSTTETGPIGYQCTWLSGNDHHVHEDAMVVEVVDEDTGLAVPDGEEGEVLVTPLSDTGMALFRYAVGDRGRLSTQPCRCGSRAAVLTLLGRTRQSLNVDSETVSADQLMSRLARLGVTDPADCQLQVLWAVNRYRVRLLLSPSTPKDITADAVAAAFADTDELNQIVTGPRCLGFTVEHVEHSDFERTERGKVPTLYQRPVTA